MSNTVVTTIKVIGERRHDIKDLFERSSVPTSFGLAWVFPEYGTVLLCDDTHGDGITVEEDAILISGESKNSPPLEAIQRMSMERPGLTFLVHGKDVANSYLQRWIFQTGEGRLLDCVQGAFEGEGEEIVYMQNGKQFQKLPDWVAADDHPDFLNQDDDSNEPARRRRSAKAIWEEWSCGGAIIPKDHPCSAIPFHAIHTLLHVLWDFHMDYNTENVLLDWIDANGLTEDFGAFLEENYHKATDE